MAKDQPQHCQIYLMAEAGLDPGALGRTLDAGAVGCVLLRSKGLDEDALRPAIAALRPVAQERDVAFLIENRALLAQETGCDGVHLSEAGSAVKDCRAVAGADSIVGVYCGGSRHAAMAAADSGADYVAFGGGPADQWWQTAADPELLTWWQAIMTAPCVAIAGDDLRTAAKMVKAGADFVAVGRYVWSHPAGPDAAVRELHAMLGGGAAES